MSLLWRDESGSIESAGYLLMIVLVGLGMIAGLATIRDQFSQGLGDLADSLSALNQSFTITVTIAGTPPTVQTYGYSDPPPPPVTQTPGSGPAGMVLTVPASAE
ncbi:MAG: hypothetical protein KatS3mg113_0954 [Planctomycetaceae bacterium]|nr:MAG: hypothetical protein KatS3mg113_0954 [Planctomycetaceae bacterium]